MHSSEGCEKERENKREGVGQGKRGVKEEESNWCKVDFLAGRQLVILTGLITALTIQCYTQPHVHAKLGLCLP